MKKFIIIIVMIMLAVVNVNAQKRANTKIELKNVCVFAPNQNGEYVRTHVYNVSDSSDPDVVIGSLANICWQLTGYNSNETAAHWCSYDGAVGYNVFNNKIICIYFSNKDSKFNKYKIYKKLPQNVVDECLEGIEYTSDDKSMFGIHLERCINDKNVSMKHIENALNTQAINNSITDENTRIVYLFTNGILTSYRTIDGLSLDAMSARDGGGLLYKNIKSNAMCKHSSINDVIKEINYQIYIVYNTNFDSDEHVTIRKKYNYNYVLYYFYKNVPNITFNEFIFYVPDYTLIEEDDMNKVIKVKNDLVFVFKNNKLIRTI